MAGTFIVGETKVRPGVYTRFENVGAAETASASNGIGACLLKADWGPLNVIKTISSAAELSAIFGSALTVDVASEMLKGGCKTVKAVRVGTGGNASTITLKDDAEVNTVTLTAKYVGARPFTATIKDSLVDATKRECIIYSGTTEFEKVTFAKGSTGIGEPAALVAAFANSSNFTASKVADGSKIIKAVTQAAFTSGTNPTTTTGDYSTALNILEAGKFNVLCVDTEDTAIHALVASFIDRIYETGALPIACIAETKTITLTTRMSNAAAFNNEKIVYCLNSAYDASGKLYDGYKLAARIGGMIAASPSNTSLTHTVISDFVSLAEPLTNTQIITAIQSGCLVLSVSSADQIWIESAINKDTGWKKIRRVKTRFELLERINTTTDMLTGKINNDNNGRATLIAAAQGVINDMAAEKKLLEGGTIIEDTNNPSAGDSAWFIIAVDDIDSVEKTYLTFQFRFSAA